MNVISYDKNQEPLITSKVTFDIFLKQEKPGDLIALYHFYYYTAKWQGTNNVKSTTSYTARGLRWTQEKVRKTKKKLEKLGFIENMIARDEDSKTIVGHYIKVNFVWYEHNEENTQKSTLWKKPEGGLSHSVEKPRTNALNTNNRNALNTNNRNTNKGEEKNNKLFSSSPSVDNESYKLFSQKLMEIVQSTKRVKVTPRKLAAWTNSIRQIVEIDEIEEDRIEDALEWYSKHHADDYVPVIESGRSLREKFIKLENAIERSKRGPRRTRPDKSGHTDLEPIQYKKPRRV